MQQRHGHARDQRGNHADDQGRGDPEIWQRSPGTERSRRRGRDEPADEGRGQHDSFEADVHDAGSLAQDAAERRESDRNRNRDGRVRHELEIREHVADQLEDDAQDWDGVERSGNAAHSAASAEAPTPSVSVGFTIGPSP